MSLKNTLNYLQFFKEVGKSKRLLRSGWIREGIKDPESVADHSFRVGVLAMVLADKFDSVLDKAKLIKMALLHDIGEAITGDIVTTRWNVMDIKKRDEKERQEREGIKNIFSEINQSDEYLSIFNEMIARDTLESEIFWQIDKLEMAIQAFEYEKEQGKNLEEFFVTADLHIKESLIRSILEKIIKSRKKEYQESLRKKLEGKI